MRVKGSIWTGEMRAFLILWIGQTGSQLGSTLSGFAISLWLYIETGSVTIYALSTVFLILPTAILSPLAGVYVDRYNRRLVMLVADSVQALATLGMVLVIYLEVYQLWHIYLAMVILSIARAFQRPAWRAAVPLIVPKEQLGRASGLERIGEGIGMILAFSLAGALLLSIGLAAILALDLLTFLLAVITLMLVRIPDPPSIEEDKAAGSVWEEMLFGWRYLFARAGLLRWVLMIALLNLFDNFASILLVPIMLNFGNEAVVSVLMGLIVSGMLFASLFISWWGGPQHRMRFILVMILLQGVAIGLVGFSQSLALIAIVSFGWMLTFSFIGLVNVPLLQTKIEPAVQGRVFASISFFTLMLDPLGRIVVGPLADRVLEPAMMEGGGLAPWLGPWLGTGPGRGLAVVFVAMGLMHMALSLYGFSNARVRLLEAELPDALPDLDEIRDEPAAQPAAVSETGMAD